MENAVRSRAVYDALCKCTYVGGISVVGQFRRRVSRSLVFPSPAKISFPSTPATHCFLARATTASFRVIETRRAVRLRGYVGLRMTTDARDGSYVANDSFVASPDLFDQCAAGTTRCARATRLVARRRLPSWGASHCVVVARLTSNGRAHRSCTVTADAWHGAMTLLSWRTQCAY